METLSERQLLEIRAWAQQTIDGVEADERFHYEPATVQVNAPLALIQVELETKHRLAKQVLTLLDSPKGKEVKRGRRTTRSR